jgi:hypothetical protein
MAQAPITLALLGWPEIIGILIVLFVLALSGGAVVAVILLTLYALRKKPGSPPEATPQSSPPTIQNKKPETNT